MDLKSYLNQNPYINIYESTHDQADVFHLMETSAMTAGTMDLIYDRTPDFESLLRCQSSLHCTVIGRNPKKNIFALVSFSFSQKWIQGIKNPCAYVGDFRTDFSRYSTLQWRQIYLNLLRSLQNDKNFGSPKYFLTAILKKNLTALRVLVQPKKDLGFYYQQIAEVAMVNVFGFLWGAPAPKYELQAATHQDEAAIREFLNLQEKEKNFGSVFDQSEADCWNERKKSWPHFSIENFLIIKDSSNKIIACTLPWNPDFAKRMRVQKLSLSLKIVFKFLNFLGVSAPLENENLKIIYLTHLNIAPSISKAEAVYAFLRKVRKLHPEVHMISFSDENGFSKKLKSLIRQSTPVLLFSVSLKSDHKLSKSAKVGFEMSLV